MRTHGIVSTHDDRPPLPPPLEWSDPPPRGGDRLVWMDLLLPVMERPHTWALVRTYDASEFWQPNMSAQNAANGLRQAARGKTGPHRANIPPGVWEFRSGRVNRTTTFGVWARYIGEGEPDVPNR